MIYHKNISIVHCDCETTINFVLKEKYRSKYIILDLDIVRDFTCEEKAQKKIFPVAYVCLFIYT